MIHSTYTLLTPTLTAHTEIKIFFKIIDCVYALQGVYILLLMVFGRRHTKKSLGGMRWCCCVMPSQWSTIDDAADVDPCSSNNDSGRNSVGLSIYYT